MRSKTILVILALFLAAGFNFSHEYKIVPGQSIAHQVKSAETAKQLVDIAAKLAQFDADFEQTFRQAAKQQSLVAKMQDQIKEHVTPQEMVPLFFRNLERSAETRVLRQKLDDDQVARQISGISQQSGSIAGQVMVNAAPPQEDVFVFAFDNHGYYAGSAAVSRETGTYAISGLPSDSFYVLTRSEVYVDQIYKNVPAALGSMLSWQQAQKVFVPPAVVEGINFELVPGVKITGTITGADGIPVEDGSLANFTVTSADNPKAIDTHSVETISGNYEMILPATGQFKMMVEVDGYKPTWHVDQQQWENATVINIVDLSATPVVDFKLTQKSDTPAGEISGSVSPVSFFIAAAFDVRDTSFVQLGISLGANYSIIDLPAGDYFVFVNDYLASQFSALAPGLVNSRGEFYDGAGGTQAVSKAKPVTVVAGQTTENINFELEAGATIKGALTNHLGAPLDSLTMVLINSDILNSTSGPFLSQFELHIFSTDSSGRYELPGLRVGTYFLRTVADFTIDLTGSSILQDGKHKGQVVDQFFGGETNLFHILDVEPLEITGENQLFQADFQLTDPHYLTGRIEDADNLAPVTDVLIVALEDTSGYPVFPFAAIDSLGNYSIGPLPQGQYKVLALTGFSGENDYLTEYFADQRSFYTATATSLREQFVTDINFALEKGATIQGYIDLLPGPGRLWAGADKMEGMPVVAYNTESGTVASFDYVQFNGGYRINRLLPGTYKVATISQPSEYATTYLGGGDVFDDVTNTVITLNFGDVTTEQIVELEKANGSIAGTVIDSASGLPLSSVFVGAYDHTGHLVGYDLTDYDASTGIQTGTTGQYAITGLRAGAYYVRTVSLFMVLPLVDDAMSIIGLFDNFDLFGFLFGGTLPGFSLDVNVYEDLWYAAEPAAISIDLDELVFQSSAYGLPNSNDNSLLPIYLPLPFYEVIPASAAMVQVSDGGSATVDFVLAPGGLGDLVVDVESNPTVLTQFQVEQNYPNPFNPSTVVTFSLADRQDVEIVVFDILGRQVNLLTRQSFEAGQHKVTWDGRDAFGDMASAGLYFARVRAGGYEKSIKMLMVK